MKFGGIGPAELIIILVVVLLIFGPKNLPKLGSAFGKTVKNLRDGMAGDKDLIEEEVDDLEVVEEEVAEVEAEVEAEAKPKPVKKVKKVVKKTEADAEEVLEEAAQE